MSLSRVALFNCSVLALTAFASAQPVPVPIAPSNPFPGNPQIQIVTPKSMLPAVPPPVPQPPVDQPAEIIDTTVTDPATFPPQQDPVIDSTTLPMGLVPPVPSPNVPPPGYTHDGYELNAGYYLTTPPPLGLISPYAGTNGSHIRYPFDSYRRPWYYPGPASHNVTILW